MEEIVRKRWKEGVQRLGVERLCEQEEVDSKIKKFQFHHEMTTDGEAVSLLHSREVEVKGKTNRGYHCKRPKSSEIVPRSSCPVS